MGSGRASRWCAVRWAACALAVFAPILAAGCVTAAPWPTSAAQPSGPTQSRAAPPTADERAWRRYADDPALAPRADFDALFVAEGATGALLIRRASDERLWVYNPVRARARTTPASSFKMLHTLIALDSGVVTDPDAVMARWDGVERWSPAWNQDQTLRSAYTRSAAWAYREVARQVPDAVMAAALADASYGDQNRAGSPDFFWVDGTVAISPREQLDLVDAMRTRALNFDADAYDAAFDIFIAERTPRAVLRAKTGWALDETTPEPNDIGWYIGWLETADGSEAWSFALVMDMTDPDRHRSARARIVRRALAAVGAPITP